MDNLLRLNAAVLVLAQSWCSTYDTTEILEGRTPVLGSSINLLLSLYTTYRACHYFAQSRRLSAISEPREQKVELLRGTLRWICFLTYLLAVDVPKFNQVGYLHYKFMLTLFSFYLDELTLYSHSKLATRLGQHARAIAFAMALFTQLKNFSYITTISLENTYYHSVGSFSVSNAYVMLKTSHRGERGLTKALVLCASVLLSLALDHSLAENAGTFSATRFVLQLSLLCLGATVQWGSLVSATLDSLHEASQGNISILTGAVSASVPTSRAAAAA